MTAGFVVSDKIRIAVFSAISHGEGDLASIVKRHRLLRPAAERAARDLAHEGLVEAVGGKWKLTPKGLGVARELGRKDDSFLSA